MRQFTYQHTGFYRPRQPWDTSLYRLVEENYEEFERVYPDRYQTKYGFWRPVVRRAVNDYLDCGDPREGFARVRCPDCGHNLFVAFFCKSVSRRMHLPCMPPKAHTGHVHQDYREYLRTRSLGLLAPNPRQRDVVPLDSRGFVFPCRVWAAPKKQTEELPSGLPGRSRSRADPGTQTRLQKLCFKYCGQVVRYYGHYSNKAQGQRARRKLIKRPACIHNTGVKCEVLSYTEH